MKRAEAYAFYEQRSAKLSDIARQLSFAGLAVVWIFKLEGSAGPRVSPELVVPAICFVGSLASDVLHYVSASLAWGIFHRWMEVKGHEERRAPVWINWPALLFFWTKVGLVLVGHGLLLALLYRRLGVS